MTPSRYVSPDEDSARWAALDLRDGDVVISTRSKHGTTWVQAICLMLVHGRARLPAPLSVLSPWLDHLVTPLDAVIARLDAQGHRRVIKTHTPLDGIPIDPRVTYVVVARHPLDAAVSLYHQGGNIDRERLHQLTGRPVPEPARTRPDIRAWVERWVDRESDPREELDSLPGVLWHLTDAWARREQDNVVLVHYDDLLGDLDGQVRRLARVLDVEEPTDGWGAIVDAASLSSMRRDPKVFAPDTRRILRDPDAFFRRGQSGEAAELLTTQLLDRYHDRAATLAPPDLLAWLHRQRST